MLGWAMFPLGLPYTLWRMLSGTKTCRNCGSEALASLLSPVGQRLYAAVEKELEDAPAKTPEEAPPVVRTYRDSDSW